MTTTGGTAPDRAYHPPQGTAARPAGAARGRAPVLPGLVPAQGRARRPAAAILSGAGAKAGAGAGLPPAGRAAVTELRLSAFGPHRGTVLPLGAVTLLRGPSGSGKTTALRAYEALALLASGAGLAEALPAAADLIPERARPDAQGRRGLRIGCTVDGPAGPVALDLAVQVEPALRIAGERLTGHGRTLLATALRDPGRGTVHAEWHTGGNALVTRAPFPDDLLGTALLPLRVAGRTPGQRRVLSAAEQVVVGLRSVFPCDPRPAAMREPVPVGAGRLHGDCRNLAEVLHRTATECPRRHARLAEFAAAGCAGPVTALGLRETAHGTLVHAVLERAARGPAPATPLGRLGDGELRYLALGLVLLTGPAVLTVDPVDEVPQALQALTVLADGLDRALDTRQTRALLALAGEICGTGHMRLVATAGESAGGGWIPEGAGESTAEHVPEGAGVTVVDLGRDRT
ncbi:ATP-binding protein [Streptomyces sp. NPDC048623]|uniref:ATP-binding protein n=1 Tax=Streptomyces sp. NPDC048623 TaxID=3155761 RepID=UPI003419DC14